MSREHEPKPSSRFKAFRMNLGLLTSLDKLEQEHEEAKLKAQGQLQSLIGSYGQEFGQAREQHKRLFVKYTSKVDSRKSSETIVRPLIPNEAHGHAWVRSQGGKVSFRIHWLSDDPSQIASIEIANIEERNRDRFEKVKDHNQVNLRSEVTVYEAAAALLAQQLKGDPYKETIPTVE